MPQVDRRETMLQVTAPATLPEVADRYLKPRANHCASVRLWLHPELRPVVVLIHGYLGGRFWIMEVIPAPAPSPAQRYISRPTRRRCDTYHWRR